MNRGHFIFQNVGLDILDRIVRDHVATQALGKAVRVSVIVRRSIVILRMVVKVDIFFHLKYENNCNSLKHY